MEVFCGSVEYTDHQVGRIVEAIEEAGELDNTLIVYIAGDNGPTPEGGLHGTMNKLSYWNGVPESLDDLANHLEDFGSPRSHGAYPTAWAYATSTPFTYGKEVTSGGGTTTAMVMSWPAGIKDNGGIRRQFHHLIDVAPTILEVVGVPEPVRVHGVDQMPMHGVSMLYTFDDPEAKDRRTTQYFELLGGRAIYQDGWWAGTRHGFDGLSTPVGGVPFAEDVWELYDTSTDFAHATDVAAEHPDRLRELQLLFDREAREYNVYPLSDNIADLLAAERPKLVSGNKASYGPGTVRLAEDAVLDIKNRSFSLVAEVENPDGSARGHPRDPGRRNGRVRAPGAERQTDVHLQLPRTGAVHDRFIRAPADGGMHRRLRLRLRRWRHGQGWHRHVVGQRRDLGRRSDRENGADHLLDGRHVRCGRGLGTPVSPTYEPPFRFTGILKKVTVEAKGP